MYQAFYNGKDIHQAIMKHAGRITGTRDDFRGGAKKLALERNVNLTHMKLQEISEKTPDSGKFGAVIVATDDTYRANAARGFASRNSAIREVAGEYARAPEQA